MQTRLSLRYNGPAVDAGLMDVYAAAANMIAFSEFVVAAAKATFGEQVEARAEVAGFARGSFVTDLVVNLGGPLVTLLTSGTPRELLGTLAEAMALWKHLRGTPPQQVQRSGADKSVTVTNTNGETIVVQAETINLVFADKPSESVGRFIRTALSGEGMDSVSIDAGEGSAPDLVARVSQREAAWFVPVAPETELFDTVLNTALIIEAPVFKDGNKWRFSDGTGSFFADITDVDFIDRVNNGEAFAKGDSLTVQMRIQQRRQVEKLLTDKTVIKVTEHRSRAPGQSPLF